MDLSNLSGALFAIVASPLLLLGLCCTAFYALGFFFYLLWSLAACLIFRDADLWTKLLPEKDVWKGGRTAWVTGASSGIGLSLCKQLAQRGCRLVMSSRRMEDLQTAKQLVIEACASKGVQLRTASDFLLLPFDITDGEATEAAVKRAEEWTGGRVDFLFNNAGIMMRGVFCSYSTAEYLINVDLLAQIRLTKLLLPLFAKNKFGHIIFTNSLFSKIVPCGTEPYCVAKAGLMSYAAALSRGPAHPFDQFRGRAKTEKRVAEHGGPHGVFPQVARSQPLKENFLHAQVEPLSSTQATLTATADAASGRVNELFAQWRTLRELEMPGECAGSRSNIYTTSAVLGMVKTGLCLRALGPRGELLTRGFAWMQSRIAEGQSSDCVAQMMLRATSNRLREAWIADGFYLFFLYLQHYTPDLANWLLDLRTEAHAAEIREEARELEEIAQRVKPH